MNIAIFKEDGRYQDKSSHTRCPEQMAWGTGYRVETEVQCPSLGFRTPHHVALTYLSGPLSHSSLLSTPNPAQHSLFLNHTLDFLASKNFRKLFSLLKIPTFPLWCYNSVVLKVLCLRLNQQIQKCLVSDL